MKQAVESRQIVQPRLNSLTAPLDALRIRREIARIAGREPQTREEEYGPESRKKLETIYQFFRKEFGYEPGKLDKFTLQRFWRWDHEVGLWHFNRINYALATRLFLDDAFAVAGLGQDAATQEYLKMDAHDLGNFIGGIVCLLSVHSGNKRMRDIEEDRAQGFSKIGIAIGFPKVELKDFRAVRGKIFAQLQLLADTSATTAYWPPEEYGLGFARGSRGIFLPGGSMQKVGIARIRSGAEDCYAGGRSSSLPEHAVANISDYFAGAIGRKAVKDPPMQTQSGILGVHEFSRKGRSSGPVFCSRVDLLMDGNPMDKARELQKRGLAVPQPIGTYTCGGNVVAFSEFIDDSVDLLRLARGWTEGEVGGYFLNNREYVFEIAGKTVARAHASGIAFDDLATRNLLLTLRDCRPEILVIDLERTWLAPERRMLEREERKAGLDRMNEDTAGQDRAAFYRGYFAAQKPDVEKAAR